MAGGAKRVRILLGALTSITLSALVQFAVLLARPDGSREALQGILLGFSCMAAVCACVLCLFGAYFNPDGSIQKGTLAICLIAIVCVSQLAIGMVALFGDILAFDREAYRAAVSLYEQARKGLATGQLAPVPEHPQIELVQLFPGVQEANAGRNSAFSYSFPSRRGTVLVTVSKSVMQRQLSTSVLAALSSTVGLCILSVELTLFFIDVAEQRPRRQSKPEGAPPAPTKHLRMFAFLFFAVSKLGSSFLPAWAQELAAGVGSAPLLTALPQTAELVAVCGSIVVCTRLLDKRGWKHTFVCGLVLSAGATVFTGLSAHYVLFTVARGVAGAGYGLVWMTLRSMAVDVPGGETQALNMAKLNAGIFAGMNFGIAFGSILSGVIGRRVLYLCAAPATLLLVLTVLPYRGGPALKPALRRATPAAERVQKRAWVQLASFVLLTVFPVGVASAFNSFFIPIRVNGIGRAATDAGALQIFYGVIIAYAGPAATAFALKRFAPRVLNCIYPAVLGLALVLAATMGGMPALFLAMVLFAAGDSFGPIVQNKYFMANGAMRGLPNTRALSALSILKKLAEAAGPVVFSWGMAAPGGVAAMGAAMVALSALFGLWGGTRTKGGRAGDKQSV